MNCFIFGPKKQMRDATIKNLALLPIMDAAISGNRPTCQNPAAIVKTLQGIGVNADAKISRNAYDLYKSPTALNWDWQPKVFIMKLPIVSKRNNPIKYPKIPPRTEPTEAINANLKDFLGFETDKAICKTSGGTGKNDDSENARTNKAAEEYFLWDHERTQS